MGDDLEEVRLTCRRILETTDGQSTLEALGAAGWADLVADAGPVVVMTLLQEKARVGGCQPLVDLVAAAEVSVPIGTRIVYPMTPGQPSARIQGDGSRALAGWAFGDIVDGPDVLALSAGPLSGLRLERFRPASRSLVSTPLSAIDPSLGLRTVEGFYAATDADVIGNEDDCDRVINAARVALATELVETSRLMVEIAVGHAQVRHQFGRPLASFQAVKHRLSSAMMAGEIARRALPQAFLDRRPVTAWLVKTLAGIAAEAAARNCLQVMGATGFTWEHPFGRLMRRSIVLDALLGSRADLERQLGAQLIAEGTITRVGGVA